MSRPLLLACVICFIYAAFPASSSAGTVLILQFHNKSSYEDLNWVGESISETLRSELSAQKQIVYSRDSRTAALKRLSLRSDADYTKATLIRLGQSLDVDYVCYGSFDATLPQGSTELKNSSIQIEAHFLDLRKLHAGPDLSEAGKLAELSRLEEHLAWGTLRYLDPAGNLPLDRFLTPQKLTRVDAQESYVRGLLSSNREQQQKWFLQAVSLDPQFASPAFELGKLYLDRKEFQKAIPWFERIGNADPRYPEARFNLGLSAYGVGNYGAAVTYFREIVPAYPLNEVYNDLGAAEDQTGAPAAVDDLRRALEGDPDDPVYQFNLGIALLRTNAFDEASQRLSAVLQHDPSDAEARTLYEKAQRRESTGSATKPVAKARLKTEFDLTTFRQLKAMVQPKGSA